MSELPFLICARRLKNTNVQLIELSQELHNKANHKLKQKKTNIISTTFKSGCMENRAISISKHSERRKIVAGMSTINHNFSQELT